MRLNTQKQPLPKNAMDKIKRQFSIIATAIFTLALLVLGIFAVLHQPIEATQTADKLIIHTVDSPMLAITKQAPVEKAEVEDKLYYDVPLTNKFQDYIDEICESYGVPPEVVIALIGVESNYTPKIISKTNDYGYMQINGINHDWLMQELGVTDFLDPYDNIRCGVYMLSELYKKYSDTTQVLMCYNCGETGAKRLWDKGVYTTDYVEKVNLAIENLERKE